jgi:hypothetical protein
LVREQSSHVLRLQKTLEDANVKLDSVLSDLMGKSGRAVLEALIAGETNPAKLAGLADRRVKASPEELREALRGRVTKRHRFLLRLHLNQIDALDAESNRMRKGGTWLKTTLVQCAWAAAKKKDSYLQAQFYRIKARRGPQKAIMAVAASILTAIYHMPQRRHDVQGPRPRSLRSTFHRSAEKALDQTFDRPRLCSHDQAARRLSLSAASPARGVCGMA